MKMATARDSGWFANVGWSGWKDGGWKMGKSVMGRDGPRYSTRRRRDELARLIPRRQSEFGSEEVGPMNWHETSWDNQFSTRGWVSATYSGSRCTSAFTAKPATENVGWSCGTIGNSQIQPWTCKKLNSTPWGTWNSPIGFGELEWNQDVYLLLLDWGRRWDKQARRWFVDKRQCNCSRTTIDDNDDNEGTRLQNDKTTVTVPYPSPIDKYTIQQLQHQVPFIYHRARSRRDVMLQSVHSTGSEGDLIVQPLQTTGMVPRAIKTAGTEAAFKEAGTNLMGHILGQLQ